MLITSDDALESAMKRSEETRDLLANALKAYLESCISLETNIYFEHGHKAPTHIISRIDSALDSLRVTATEQLTRCKATVSRIRNKLVSSVRYLPQEVLSDIFFHVVYSPENNSVSMNQGVKAMYSELCNLMLVCSTWRKLALDHSVLWETIPACDKTLDFEAINTSLQRTGSRGVRLAVVAPWGGALSRFMNIIVGHTHRIRGLYVEGGNDEDIYAFIRRLVEDHAPLELSQLSLRYTCLQSIERKAESTTSLPESLYSCDFKKLISSLSVLLLDRIQVRWDNTVFTDRLVELAIYRVKLKDSPSSMTEFMLAISSATALRDLRIMRMEVCAQSTEAANTTISSRIDFRNLRILLLEDLSFNVLELFLLKIAPGTYHSTLVLTDKAVTSLTHYYTFASTGIDKLVALLSHTQTDTLVLDRGDSVLGPWLDGSGLCKLLNSLPTLKELAIHGWRFDETFCHDLFRPLSSDTEDGTHGFPTVDTLYLTNVNVLDLEGFKRIIAKISSQAVILGGRSRAGELSMDDLLSNKEFIDWIKCNVPEVRLVASGFLPPVMRPKGWVN
ncbi:hypothetical protein RHS02_08280, partial [Rhizoctonia solani]